MMDMKVMKEVTKKSRKKTSSPVSNTPVLVIRRVAAFGSDKGEEVSRINPNAIHVFASEYGLDVRACESCAEKGPHVNHNGFTFKIEGV